MSKNPIRWNKDDEDSFADEVGELGRQKVTRGEQIKELVTDFLKEKVLPKYPELELGEVMDEIWRAWTGNCLVDIDMEQMEGLRELADASDIDVEDLVKGLISDVLAGGERRTVPKYFLKKAYQA